MMISYNIMKFHLLPLDMKSSIAVPMDSLIKLKTQKRNMMTLFLNMQILISLPLEILFRVLTLKKMTLILFL